MVFYRIGRHFPVFLFQFDQSLYQSVGILYVDIDIHHAMADEQIAFQSIRMEDGRTPSVGYGVGLRFIEDVGSVTMVVGCPVCDRPQSCTCSKNVGLIKHGHQSDESSITAAINTNLFGVDAMLFHQIFCSVYIVAQVFTTHEPIDACPDVATIASAGPVVHVQDGIAFIHEQIVEHVFPEVGAPPLVGILKVSGTMDENDRFAIFGFLLLISLVTLIFTIRWVAHKKRLIQPV